MSFETLGRLIDYNALNSDNYSALEMLRDLRKGIWSEANLSQNVTVYRRNLQRAHIDQLANLMTDEMNRARSRKYYNVNKSDVRALVRGEINVWKQRLRTATNAAVNTETKYHYRDAIARIDNILNPK